MGKGRERKERRGQGGEGKMKEGFFLLFLVGAGIALGFELRASHLQGRHSPT
jgi:hypothetical protein